MKFGDNLRNLRKSKKNIARRTCRKGKSIKTKCK